MILLFILASRTSCLLLLLWLFAHFVDDIVVHPGFQDILFVCCCCGRGCLLFLLMISLFILACRTSLVLLLLWLWLFAHFVDDIVVLPGFQDILFVVVVVVVVVVCSFC